MILRPCRSDSMPLLDGVGVSVCVLRLDGGVSVQLSPSCSLLGTSDGIFLTLLACACRPPSPLPPNCCIAPCGFYISRVSVA
jgi:hypothetical protein